MIYPYLTDVLKTGQVCIPYKSTYNFLWRQRRPILKALAKYENFMRGPFEPCICDRSDLSSLLALPGAIGGRHNRVNKLR